MLENLCMEISQWSKLGEQILLMIELNEKITSDPVTEIFANVGLRRLLRTTIVLQVWCQRTK